MIPTGGPPHAALAKSPLANPGEEAYQYPLDTRQFIDQGFGYFDRNGPGALQDPAFIPRWLEESVSTGGNDYYHPDTRIHFILGDGDLRQQANGSYYYNRLLAEGSPSVTWEIVPNTGHGTTGTEQGRAAYVKSRQLRERLDAFYASPGAKTGDGGRAHLRSVAS